MPIRNALPLLIPTLLSGSMAAASESVPPGLYEITVETHMPHLEESLRYATTREKRCLQQVDLASAFPVLKHASLADCRLEPQPQSGDEIHYLLVCDGGHGTTGNAVWTREAQRIGGTLHVKLGGKNMTFSQRWTAVRQGQCPTQGQAQ